MDITQNWQSNIIKKNIKACNGFIHEVDDVMLPQLFCENNPGPICRSITEIACESSNFGILCDALKYTNLDGPLKNGSWTMFAPNDDAMKKLMKFKNVDDIRDIPKDALEETLMYHTVFDDKLEYIDFECGDNLSMGKTGEMSMM